MFEAARAGAVNNARMSAIRQELGYRLAPLQGGDGTQGKAAAAIARSLLAINDPLNTRVAILNPTPAAFRDWAVRDQDSGERFIPVNHMRHQTYDIGRHSGLSLRDATLLKVQVTHGVDLRVPVVGKLMTAAMRLIDIDNAVFYLRDKWPMQSVATVRMQSDALETEILSSAEGGVSVAGGNGGGVAGGGTDGGVAGGGTSGGTTDETESGSGSNPDGGLADGGNGAEGVDPDGGLVDIDESGAEEIAVAPPEELPQCEDGSVLAISSSVQSADDQMLSTSDFRLLLAAAATPGATGSSNGAGRIQ